MIVRARDAGVALEQRCLRNPDPGASPGLLLRGTGGDVQDPALSPGNPDDADSELVPAIDPAPIRDDGVVLHGHVSVRWAKNREDLCRGHAELHARDATLRENGPCRHRRGKERPRHRDQGGHTQRRASRPRALLEVVSCAA